MSVHFRFEVLGVPAPIGLHDPEYCPWQADVYVRNSWAALPARDCYLTSVKGESPGAVLDAAENAGRLALEKLLGLWAEGTKEEEIAR